MEDNNEVNVLENEEIKNEPEVENGKGNKKKLWLIVISVIIILVVGVALYATNVQRYDIMDKKPVIYLYPEEEMQLSVKLGKEDNITCSYPKYENGWNVVAKPDGTLIDVKTGRKLYALYWEGIHSTEINTFEGFVVNRDETIEFLEEKLSILGLNELEAEEFIIYWLPIFQENEYTYIRFATLDEINENMPLEFSVEPDTLIRVLMLYRPLDKYIEIKEQKLVPTQRKGFTVVEWGGTEI